MNSAATPVTATVVTGGLASRGHHPLDTGALYAVGLAFGRQGPDTTGPVILGHDGREQAAALAAAAVRGLREAGRDVLDLDAVTADGLCFCAGAYGSPALYVGSGSRYAVDVRVTFWAPGVAPLDSSAVTAIASAADDWLAQGQDGPASEVTETALVTGRHTRREITQDYAAFLTMLAGGPSRHPRTVAVDAGGPAIVPLLDALVASGGDGPTWPVRIVMTGHAQGDMSAAGDSYGELRALRELIAREPADFGVAFDGDGDQVVLLDDQGALLMPEVVAEMLGLPVDRLQVTHAGDYRWPELWGTMSGLACVLHVLIALDATGRTLSAAVSTKPSKETLTVPELHVETRTPTLASAGATAGSTGPAPSAPDHGLQPWMRALLRCPACLGELRDADGPEGPELACAAPECGRSYPIVEGIPVLLVDQARVLSGER